MLNKFTPPRELEKAHQPRPKFLQRISSKLLSTRDGAVVPTRASTWASHKSPEPSLYYDERAIKRRREAALRERGLLPPLPAEPAPTLSPPSSPAAPSFSISDKSNHELRERGLLPPSMHRHLEGHGHTDDWDAMTLVAEIKMENALAGKRQTAAERIKSDWKAGRTLTTHSHARGSNGDGKSRPFSWLDVDTGSQLFPGRPGLNGIQRQRTISSPASPLNETPSSIFPLTTSQSYPAPVTSQRPSRGDLPPLELSSFPPLTRSLSTPSSTLSGETLHPRAPLQIQIHSPNTMLSEASKIKDKESRRMTMLAFVN